MDESEPKMNNVVPFPGKSRNRPPQNLEEILSMVLQAKTARIEEVTEIVIVQMFQNLFDNAFDFTERHDTNKDMAFLIEAMKSMMCRHDGIDHPFQALAERFFEEDANGDLTFLEFEDEIVEIEKVVIEIGGDGEVGC